MVVEWAKKVSERLNDISYADVSELDMKDSKGNLIEKLPVRDLSNVEQQTCQRHPMVMKAIGELKDFMSLKSQNYSIVLTIQRLKKGNQDLDLTPEYIKKNWSITDTLKLIIAVSNAVGESEKNLQNLAEVMKEDSS